VTYANFMWQEYILDLEDMVRKIGNSANFLQGGVQSNDASVIYNIQCLKAMLVKAEGEAKCTGLVYSVLKKKGEKVFLAAPDSSGPEMSLEKAEQWLENLESEKWTLETLKAKIPEECKTAISQEEFCPDFESGYQHVIKTFEV